MYSNFPCSSLEIVGRIRGTTLPILSSSNRCKFVSLAGLLTNCSHGIGGTWQPEPVSIYWWINKSVFFAGSRTNIPRLSSPYPSHYTNYTLMASVLTHWGRVTQICVFTLQLCKPDDAVLRFYITTVHDGW